MEAWNVHAKAMVATYSLLNRRAQDSAYRSCVKEAVTAKTISVTLNKSSRTLKTK